MPYLYKHISNSLTPVVTHARVQRSPAEITTSRRIDQKNSLHRTRKERKKGCELHEPRDLRNSCHTGVSHYNGEANEIETKLSHCWALWDLEFIRIFFKKSRTT